VCAYSRRPEETDVSGEPTNQIGPVCCPVKTHTHTHAPERCSGMEIENDVELRLEDFDHSPCKLRFLCYLGADLFEGINASL
jgi:hypothetical protein